MATKPVQGNLHLLLASHDQHNNGNSNPGGGPSDISLQLDVLGRDRSSTLGSIRERGLTFGSEFDLGIGLGSLGGGGGNIGGGEVIQGTTFDLGNVPNNVPSTNCYFTQGNVVSANSSSTSGTLIPNGVGIPSGVSHVLENGVGNLGIDSTSAINMSFNNNLVQPPSSHPSSEGSASNFLNGFFSGNGGVQSDNGSQMGNNNLQYGQTPPSNTATSYEISHFGKRMRAGSISGRLRSMSDLQDRGIIDQQQKGIMKDLIISGNDDLQAALNKYEQGETTQLVNMINSGVLNNKDANDIDILADLDLGFLNVNEDFGQGVGSVPGIVLDEGNCETKAMPIPMISSSNIDDKSRDSDANSSLHTGNGSSTISQTLMSPALHPHASSSLAYDGIGELDFNEDYDNVTFSMPQTGTSTFTVSSSHLPQQAHSTTSSDNSNYQKAVHPGYRPREDSIVDMQRFRANSLAFGDLFEEPNPDDQHSVFKWMDQPPIMTDGNSNNDASSQVVGANGGLYILNNRPTATMKISSEEEKKASRVRDRLEKKVTREQQMREKKEKVAKERQDKKDMKAAQSKLRQEERKKSKNGGDISELRKNKKDVEMEGSDEDLKEVTSGTGRPRSLSDPNLSIGLDDNGLMHVGGPPDWVGAYSPQSRKIRIERFLAKRNHRVWVKKVKYDVRKNFADSRLRVKGRFVKKEDELLMRDLMSLT